jgi:catechol 2,3-dioxygenase-like lactoylglutathione lyase family enzyme
MKRLKPVALAAALMATGGTAKATEPVLTGQIPHMYPGYITEDLAATRDFFVRKLGFTQIFESEWFALLKLEGNQIGLMKPEQAGQAAIFRQAYSGNGAWITFDMPDVDAAYTRAKAAGLDIIVDIRDEPWGERHFSIVAPGGLAIDFVTYKGPLAD